MTALISAMHNATTDASGQVICMDVKPLFMSVGPLTPALLWLHLTPNYSLSARADY